VILLPGRQLQLESTQFKRHLCADGAQPGSLVHLEGCQPPQSYPKEFKHWKKMLPALVVKSSAATFDGTALVTDQGPITVDKAVPDGAAIS